MYRSAYVYNETKPDHTTTYRIACKSIRNARNHATSRAFIPNRADAYVYIYIYIYIYISLSETSTPH